MAKISLLVTPRPFYPTSVIMFLDTFIGKLADKTSTEFLIKIDDDDEINGEALLPYKNLADVQFIINNGELGRSGLHIYLNNLAQIATGDILWCVGDRLEMLTDQWDTKFIQFVEPFMSIPYTFYIPGINHGAEFICINRAWYKATGCFATHPSCDSLMARICDSLFQKTGNRHSEIIRPLQTRDILRGQNKTKLLPPKMQQKFIARKQKFLSICCYNSPEWQQIVENHANQILNYKGN